MMTTRNVKATKPNSQKQKYFHPKLNIITKQLLISPYIVNNYDKSLLEMYSKLHKERFELYSSTNSRRSTKIGDILNERKQEKKFVDESKIESFDLIVGFNENDYRHDLVEVNGKVRKVSVTPTIIKPSPTRLKYSPTALTEDRLYNNESFPLTNTSPTVKATTESPKSSEFAKSFRHYTVSSNTDTVLLSSPYGNLRVNVSNT